jgi:hypothetical protein
MYLTLPHMHAPETKPAASCIPCTQPSPIPGCQSQCYQQHASTQVMLTRMHAHLLPAFQDYVKDLLAPKAGKDGSNMVTLRDPGADKDVILVGLEEVQVGAGGSGTPADSKTMFRMTVWLL